MAQSEAKADFATRLGVSRARVSQLVAMGLPVAEDGRVLVEEGLDFVANRLDGSRSRAARVATTARDDAPTVGLTDARQKHELLKAERTALKIEIERGALVDRDVIGRAVFGFARAERDAWLGWSARSAAALATETGADLREVAAALDRLVREHLEELAGLPLPEALDAR